MPARFMFTSSCVAVAHIKVPSGEWWRFDDETVVHMGAAPVWPTDHGVAAGVCAWGVVVTQGLACEIVWAGGLLAL